MVFWWLRHVDNGVVSLGMTIDDRGSGGDGILATNRGGGIERL